jgi:hypothetical protein
MTTSTTAAGSCFSTATQPQRLSYPTSARLHPVGGPSDPDRQQAIGIRL